LLQPGYWDAVSGDLSTLLPVKQSNYQIIINNTCNNTNNLYSDLDGDEVEVRGVAIINV